MTQLPNRRRPAHPPPLERHNQPIILFVTLCVKERKHVLATPEIHAIFVDALADADAWRVGFYLIMPDHVHFFCTPATYPRIPIKRWSTYLKCQISKRISHRTWRWQSNCWDLQMRSTDHYTEKLAYVRKNPERASLTADANTWPYQGTIGDIPW